MDVIEYSGPSILIAVQPYLAGATLLIIVLLGLESLSYRSNSPLILVFPVLAFAVSGMLFATLGAVEANKQDRITAVQQQRVEQIAATYGLNLDGESLSQLNYPDAEPRAGAEVRYGFLNEALRPPALVDRGQQVQLLWTGYALRLMAVAEDGSPGEELPRLATADDVKVVNEGDRVIELRGEEFVLEKWDPWANG